MALCVSLKHGGQGIQVKFWASRLHFLSEKPQQSMPPVFQLCSTKCILLWLICQSLVNVFLSYALAGQVLPNFRSWSPTAMGDSGTKYGVCRVHNWGSAWAVSARGTWVNSSILLSPAVSAWEELCLAARLQMWVCMSPTSSYEECKDDWSSAPL